MRIKASIFALFISLCCLPQTAAATETLIPGGQVIGLELQENRIIVAAFDEVLGADAKEAGMEIGDQIVAIDDRKVSSAMDVQNALAQSRGTVRVQILRNGEMLELRMLPFVTPEGPRLGVYLRQGITGIGTVTWYDPDNGVFGALGHGVNGVDGSMVEMTQGNVYRARIQSVKKGKVGQPGQLVGSITDPEPVGSLNRNTERGVFGQCKSGWQGIELPVAEPEEVAVGSAVILSTVDGALPQDYSVEILKIYPGNREDGRNMLIRITDPELLAATGGIVQGMSGSPIIQNGKLIGAVTHVLVNDPTRGYGIFIENMLDAAG